MLFKGENMPPKKRIFKEDILKAAASVIQKHGEQALTARGVADELGCSTQPIYSEFENLDQLREDLFEYARDHYLRINANSYKEFALSFLHFAKTQKNLFRFLYLRERTLGERLMDDANYDLTIDLLSRNLELSPEQAREMHRRMQYYCYSMGVMIATGYLDFSEEEISKELTEFYSIILRYYKSVHTDDELENWLKRSRNLMI
jgi:AcrR family transcriptional regulator